MPARVDITTLVREVKEVRENFPTWTLDNAFVHWFIQAFLVADPELAARGVTGVAHDKGVDGVFIDEAVQKVFVLQGKFHQAAKPPTEPRPDVISFAHLSRTLLGPNAAFQAYLATIDLIVGQRLQAARDRVRRGYQLHLYYVTTGRCSAPLKSEAEGEVNQATGNASLSILDRRDILALLVDYLGGAAPPVPYLDLHIDARGIQGADGVIQRFDQHSGIDSWILSMSGRDLGQLYAKAGDRLFARNIRGFLGDTAINDGMTQTLDTAPGNFWYFNNGVTIVCDSARKTSERGETILRVTNPQIINGQQTTRTLHSAPTNKASVLVRVISVPRDGGRTQSQFEGLVSNIVAATNWQNAILPSDLRANDSRQIALQRDFAKLRYHYLRKRQTKQEAKRLLGSQHWFWLKKDELAQLVAACDFDPVTVRKGKEGLFKAPHYDDIFDGRSIKEYLSIYWVGRIVKYEGAGYPDRAYAKWHVLHFLWKRLAPMLRSRAAADHFRGHCERKRWPLPLDEATEQVYRAMLEFYRLKRGKGAQALDISNFFYRPHQHTAFEKFWASAKNRRRARFRLLLNKFQNELSEAVAS
jgi:hypothetical protein